MSLNVTRDIARVFPGFRSKKIRGLDNPFPPRGNITLFIRPLFDRSDVPTPTGPGESGSCTGEKTSMQGTRYSNTRYDSFKIPSRVTHPQYYPIEVVRSRLVPGETNMTNRVSAARLHFSWLLHSIFPVRPLACSQKAGLLRLARVHRAGV